MGALAARIGPNAVIQTAAALAGRVGERRAARLVRAATGRAWGEWPAAMVDEGEVQALVRAVHEALGERAAGRVLRDAGRRTADYLLAHRIPRAAQRAIAAAPAAVGLWLLCRAMGAHSWTFAGSGRFAYAVGWRPGRPSRLEVRDCPMCRTLAPAGAAGPHAPVCAFYAGTFERLVQALVRPGARVTERACEALGDDACRFAVELTAGG